MRQLENIIYPPGSSNWDTDTQLAILILETQSGGIGNYGGPNALSGEEFYFSIEALEQLQEITSASGGILTGIPDAITAARGREAGRAVAEVVGDIVGAIWD